MCVCVVLVRCIWCFYHHDDHDHHHPPPSSPPPPSPPPPTTTTTTHHRHDVHHHHHHHLDPTQAKCMSWTLATCSPCEPAWGRCFLSCCRRAQVSEPACCHVVWVGQSVVGWLAADSLFGWLAGLGACGCVCMRMCARVLDVHAHAAEWDWSASAQCARW